MPTAQELLPDPNKPLSEHSELQLLAMVLFGEARGEPPQTREGIGHAIINRALHPSWWGRNLKEVILKPWQFSSFNGPEVILVIKPHQVDPNYRKLREPLRYESPQVWGDCCNAAIEAYKRLTQATLPDLVKGANHYYDTSIPAPRWADPEKFVLALPASRRGHEVRFYKL
ncbi:MAG: hypothetical protein A3G93_09555 [Nitrospinae bacterium RIFCSPLOWO2_12_FULL_45_22]|nr:MAG: hypothetical protein A3G93_09555 [Nitrospinae bacterium RIFCSPLOWO2_12_FULL_45_22]